MTNDKQEPTIQRRVNVLLDGDIHQQLRHEAVNLNQPMAAIIQSVLKQHFSHQEQQHNGD